MSVSVQWRFYASFTVDHTKVSADQTDFPVPLVWSGNTATSNMPSDPLIYGTQRAAKLTGADIRFTSDSFGVTELPFELVQFSQTTSETTARCEIHVKLSAVSSSTDTVFYMWWGNPYASAYATTDTYGRNAVWSSSYISVWHMNEASGSAMTDSSGNLDATYQSALPSRQAQGPMGSSQLFSNVANCWAFLNSASKWGFNGGTENMTLMAISKRVTSGEYQSLFSKCDGNSSSDWGNLRWEWYESVGGDGTEGQVWRGTLGGDFISSSTTVGVTSSTAYDHLVYTYNHVNGINYINNSAETIITDTGNLPDDTYDSCVIGNWNGNPGSDQLRSYVDELRVSNTARSSTWITTEYNALISPQTFISRGVVKASSIPTMRSVVIF